MCLLKERWAEGVHSKGAFDRMKYWQDVRKIFGWMVFLVQLGSGVITTLVCRTLKNDT